MVYPQVASAPLNNPLQLCGSIDNEVRAKPKRLLSDRGGLAYRYECGDGRVWRDYL
ncbi:hypothetical protein IFM12275_33660 [Nocardia sputorum]|uniref:Uncharacterized protein n=1 Tax=Nocardia sputorum TaxID=2984338 RepID=A0ABN6UEC4_9NOCA|nr:hypothetical protein IFM12275_33660 [Nocardia sputorum]BDU03275.1 hypothetical protein IFM12276_63030 [Nocardia sputorum]